MLSQRISAATARISFCSHIMRTEQKGRPFCRICAIVSAIFHELYHYWNLFVNLFKYTKNSYFFVYFHKSGSKPFPTPEQSKNTLPFRVFLPGRNRNFLPEVRRRGEVFSSASAIFMQRLRNYSTSFAQIFQGIFYRFLFFRFLHNSAAFALVNISI